MAIVDPVYFVHERNHFPALTDKEFEALLLYCQMMNLQKVAEYQNRTSDVIGRHLQSCRKKMGVKDDYELYLIIIQKCINFERSFPELTPRQVVLLAAFSFYPKRSSIRHRFGIYSRDIYEELIKIKNDLEVSDLNTLRMLFFMRITLFP